MNSLEKAKWNKYANDYIRKVEAFCQREIYKKFKLSSVKLDWSINRRSSRGGCTLMDRESTSLCLVAVETIRDKFIGYMNIHPSMTTLILGAFILVEVMIN